VSENKRMKHIWLVLFLSGCAAPSSDIPSGPNAGLVQSWSTQTRDGYGLLPAKADRERFTCEVAQVAEHTGFVWYGAPLTIGKAHVVLRPGYSYFDPFGYAGDVTYSRNVRCREGW